MQNNNRDCRPITRATGVGDGTCNYNSICTRGVGGGTGNNACYINNNKNNIDAFTSNEGMYSYGNSAVNVTFIVNITLVILILLIIYKIYNPSVSYF